jgi:hypothetical protein
LGIKPPSRIVLRVIERRGLIGSGLAIAVVPLLSALVSALATKGDLEADAGERTSCV